MNYANESEREFREWQAAVAMQYGLEIAGMESTKPRLAKIMKDKHKPKNVARKEPVHV
jgi:hypothetical protein